MASVKIMNRRFFYSDIHARGEIPSYAHIFKNPYVKASDWGWQIDRVEKDGAIHDPYRVSYLREHIAQMKLAVDVVDLVGYTPWGIIDIISFETGEMEKRYGSIHVDKDSFDWYKNVIATNSEEL